MNKKEQREAIKEHILNQKNKIDSDTIIYGSASKVTVMKKVCGIWKQEEYPTL